MRLSRCGTILPAILLVFALALIPPGCSEEDETSADYDALIELGKANLEVGQHRDAFDVFSEALDERPRSSEARWGIVLADVLMYAEDIDALAGLLSGDLPVDVDPADASAFCQGMLGCGALPLDATYGQCLDEFPMGFDEQSILCVARAETCDELYACIPEFFPPDLPTCRMACSKLQQCGSLETMGMSPERCTELCPILYNGPQAACYVYTDGCAEAEQACFDFTGSTLQYVIEQYHDDIVKRQQIYIDDILDDPLFTFRLDSYNYTVFDRLMQFSLAGTHDHAEVHFIAAQVSLMRAAMDMALTLDLDYNARIFADAELELPVTLAPEQIEDFMLQIYVLAEYALHDPVYNNFLGIRPGADADGLRRAGMEIGMCFGHLAQTVTAVEQQPGSQYDDAIRYIDLNGNGRWDDDEFLLIQGVGEFEKPLALALRDLFIELKINFTDGAPFHISVLKPIFDYLDLGWISSVIDALDLLGWEELDPGAFFRDPDPDGLRTLLREIQHFLAQFIRWEEL